MYDMQQPNEAFEDSSGSPEHGDAPDAVAEFLVRAQQRRALHCSDSEQLTGSWFEPDSKAIIGLGPTRHPVSVYLREISDSGSHRANRKHLLRHLVADLTGVQRAAVTWDDVMAFPWHHVNPDQAAEYHALLAKRYPNRGTQHVYRQLLRSIINRCSRAKLISRAYADEVLEELPSRAVRQPARNARRLEPVDIAALMAAAGDSPAFMAARDCAVIAVFTTTGLRASELVRLDLVDWDTRNRVLRLLGTKNGQDRTVPVDARTTRYLERWLAHRGSRPGPLFTGNAGRLSTDSIRGRVQKLAHQAGVGHMGTHDFRRMVATTLLRTHDAFLVSKLLGHASLSSTMVYDLVGQDQQREAIATLPLPDLGGEDAASCESEDRL